MDILEIAYEEGFSVATTTKGQHIITGFSDWDEIQEISKKYGLTPVELRRRCGHTTWDNLGQVWELFDMVKVYDDDPNFKMYFKDSDVLQELKDRIADCVKVQDVISLAEKFDDIADEIYSMEDDEFLLVGCYKHDIVDTLKMKGISYNYDVWNYTIGLE